METLNKWWENAKTWFKNSTTIAYARLQVAGGFLLAVLGNIDWTSVTSWDWHTPKTNLWIGVGLMVNGIITEVLRRRSIPAA